MAKQKIYVILWFLLMAHWLLSAGGDAEGNRVLSYKEALLKNSILPRPLVVKKEAKACSNLSPDPVEAHARPRHENPPSASEGLAPPEAVVTPPGVLSYAAVLKLRNATASPPNNRNRISTGNADTRKELPGAEENRRMQGNRRTPSPHSPIMMRQESGRRVPLSEQQDDDSKDLEGVRQSRLLSRYARQRQGGSFSHSRRSWRTGTSNVVEACQVRLTRNFPA
jgi:hypothetical protein